MAGSLSDLAVKNDAYSYGFLDAFAKRELRRKMLRRWPYLGTRSLMQVESSLLHEVGAQVVCRLHFRWQAPKA